MKDLTEQLIAEEEGLRRCAYTDSRGYLTIGIGCCVDTRVPGTGLCDAAIDAQFAHDRAEADAVCQRIPNFAKLNANQQAALTSVAFQLGGQILGWKNFMLAMGIEDWHAASNELLDSEWARKQTPHRAEREAAMLSTGEWVEKIG